VPAGSKTEPPLPKAKPISDSGVITYRRRCYGLAVAGNKSAEWLSLPPLWCGGEEWKETGRNWWVGIRAV